MATSASLLLSGYRVLVTRARAQAGALAERLEQLGATVVELPAIEIVPADPAPLDAAIRDLTRYDWIVFTSANGVAAFTDRLDALGLNALAMNGIKIGAIGRVTAERLREFRVHVDFVPKAFVAESVVAELTTLGVDGKRVLLPQAEIARKTVADGLRRAGASVDVVVAYRTVAPDRRDAGEIQRLLSDVHVATFASPSAVRNALALAGGSLPGVSVVCIGPVTAAAAREAGLEVSAVADEYSMDGLINAIVRLVASAEKEVPDGNRS